MKKGFTNRFIGWAMSLVMLVSMLPATALADDYGIMTAGTVYHSDQMLTKDTDTRIPFLLFNGVQDIANFAPTQVSWTNPANGTVYQAYCINPAYSGYGDVPDYGIDIEKFDSSCIVDAGGSGGSGKTAGFKSSAGNTVAAFLEGAVNHGFPTVSAETLLSGSASSYGVSQKELDYAAYLATKLAIWSGIHDSYGISSWSANYNLGGYSEALKTKVVEATRSIYNKAGSYTPHDGTSDVTFTAGTPTKSGSNYETVLTIGNTDNNVEGSEMYIEMLNGGSFPDGLTIVDENGDELETTTTSGGNARYVLPEGTTSVTVIVPDPGEAGAQYDFRLYAQQNKKVLLYGRSTKDATQSYVLAGNHYDNPTTGFAINQEYTDIPIEPGDPDVPDTQSSSSVTIQKVEKGTTTGLAGAQFKVTRLSHWEMRLVDPDFDDGENPNPDEEDSDDVEEWFEIVETEELGTHITDGSGKINLTLSPGRIKIEEIVAPDGYRLSEDNVKILDIPFEETGVDASADLTVTFENAKHPDLLITKYDEKTSLPLAGAEFSVKKKDGTIVFSGVTDAKGELAVDDLEPGWYTITELAAPDGYLIATESQDVELIAGERNAVVKFDNRPRPDLLITKLDSVTEEPLANAIFEVKEEQGKLIGQFTTDKKGQILVEDLDEKIYTVTELTAPENYVKDGQSSTIELKWGETGELVFTNTLKPTLVVNKTDATTNKGIPNTTYKIQYETANGGVQTIGTYKTDADGQIVLPYVEPGWYIITETIPAQGYQKPTNPVTRIYLSAGDNAYPIDSVLSGTVNSGLTNAGNSITTGFSITSGADYPVVGDIVNYPLNSIVIKKSDANTGEMLDGATFEVIRVTGETSGQNGTVVCTVTTDHSGVIVITGLEAGAYAIREIKAPQNYVIAETDLQTVNLKADGTSVVEVIFRNYPYGAISINKVDGISRQPLEGATFKVTTSAGAEVGSGEYVTDANGNILIGNLHPGSYVITETVAPEGYVLSTQPTTVEVGTDGSTITKTFSNYKKGNLQIRKFDADTKELLAGATFKVTEANGAVVGTSNGIYTTDESGIVTLTGLDKGTYIVTEISAPEGYGISENPSQKIEIDDTGKTYTVDFYNKEMKGVQIIKIDSETREPLQGAQFQIWQTGASSSTSVAAGTPAGVLVGTYTTDINGVINVVLEEGTYEILETKAPEGYQLDNHKQDIVVKDGQQTSVTFTNTKLPDGTILIHKTDSKTGDSIEGVEFEIRRENGELIAQEKTDKQGEITITDLEEGIYYVKETKAQEGYKEDTESHKVVLGSSGFVKVEIENDPLASILIHKIDSVTGDGIEGVTFILYDADNDPVGQFVTDDEGYIYIEDELEEGRYKLREIEPADGYMEDTKARTIYVQKGKTTEVEWENTPQLGQIKIKKISGDYNETSALPKGTPLEGAIFEIYNYKTGNVVDRIETDYYGVANSKPLPLGRYIVKEVQAPSFYKINPEEIDVTVEFATQVINITVENYSANISAEINKFGPYEVMPGQSAIYTIKNVRNSSTVPLTDFYWRDMIPTAAGTLDKIVTGTYNLQGRYKVVATTSYGNTIVLADNLDTARNNVIQCAPAAVGLNNGEYITSFSLMFGTVQPGFTQVQDAKVYLKVKNTNLPNGYVFANKADVGGRYGNEWATSNATWTTSVYNPAAVKLPKTGW